nr:Probable ubiquinone biosynthesis protein UbiB [Klebsiella pneumoniae]
MHTARLKENGKEVVIKVIRPDILPIIKADMKLIYRRRAGYRVCCLTVAVCARRR